MKRLLRAFRFAERGNVTLLTALAAVPLLGIAGMATDYIRANAIETSLSAALDAAVLAGAMAANNNEKAAQTYFLSNFPVEGAKLASVNFTKSGNLRIDGTAVIRMSTSFSSVLGIRSLNLKLTAAAVSKPNSTGLCLLALSPNETQSLLANSGADVTASGCEIHVKSTANPAAIFNSGTSIKSNKLCIQGTGIINNGGTQTNLQTGCSTVADPFAGKIPAPASTACDYNNLTYSGNVTLNPGVYCGWHNFNSGSNVTLRPGTYVIKSGGWNVNGGEWNGNGVTFYFADTSKIQFNSAVKADLRAPTTGTYANVLFAEPAGLSHSQFIFNDNLGFLMQGIMYLPSREVVFNSNSTLRSQQITAVMRKVIFNQTRWTLTPPGGASGAKMARLIQ